MGWSCRADAAKVLDAWSACCRKATGQSNVFESGGTRFFFENSRREHADGAVTGSIMKMLPSNPGSDTFYARKAGSFRIEGDGTVSKAPAALKAFASNLEEAQKALNPLRLPGEKWTAFLGRAS